MISNNIKLYCHEKNIKLNKLSKMTGISLRNLYSWIENRTDTPADQLYLIAEALNVPIEKFFENV